MKYKIEKSAAWTLLAQFLFLLFCSADCLAGDGDGEPVMENAATVFQRGFNTVKDDYLEFYSRKRLLRMLAATGAGALMANTHIDQEIQDWYQHDARSSATDDLASVTKQFGEYKYVVPLLLVSGLAGHYLGESYDGAKGVGAWGLRSMRAYLVGFPLQITAQYLTGASRPVENRGSDWRPFKDNNGVSGHAFIGAVPFLTLARMNDDNPYLKYFFYAASTLTGLSRINDNAHYFSQAVLGWYIAWEATGAVADRDREERRVSVGPALMGDTWGIEAAVNW